MTIHTKHTHNKKDINQSRSSRQQQLIDIPCPPFSMSFSSSSELWLLRSAAIVCSRPKTKSFLPKVAWEGGEQIRREAPAGETEGREGAGEGGYIYSYFPMSSALSQSRAMEKAIVKKEDKQQGVAHAHAEGRGVHEKTCAVSISLHPGVECLAICPRPPPVLWFLPLNFSVHRLHFFCCSCCGSSSVFGIVRKEDNL